MKKGKLWVLGLFAALLLACQRDERELVVFAAASLRDAFSELGQTFEREHGVKVTFNFAGSQELRTQIEHGASVDVFAAADEVHMTALRDAGRVETPEVFAGNGLVLVVSNEARDRVRSLADLPSVERLVIGGETVPVGRYTLQMLDKANRVLGPDFRRRVENKVISRELNVRQVLAKVKLGEAEAGIVYRTDAATTTDVTAVVLPPEVDVVAVYPITKVIGAPHPELAQAWLTLVKGEAGQRVLAKAGFVQHDSAR